MKKISFIILLACSICAYKNISEHSIKNFKKPDTKQYIYITGSSSMQEVCENLSNSFMKKYPNIEVIKSITGSAEAPYAVRKNTAQIGDISKKLKKEQNPNLFNIHVVAYDAIAICTNNRLKIKNLKLTTIKKIFSGEIKNWNQLGGPNEKIILIGRDEASGTRETLETILNLKDRCNYSVILENNGKVKFKIQNDENAIGYISLAAADKTVNTVAIDGVKPSINSIKERKYPFIHPLIQITNKNLVNDTVNLWFKFVFSQKGREIIEANKLFPVYSTELKY